MGATYPVWWDIGTQALAWPVELHCPLEEGWASIIVKNICTQTVLQPTLVHLATVEPLSILIWVTLFVQHMWRPVGHLGAMRIGRLLAYVVSMAEASGDGGDGVEVDGIGGCIVLLASRSILSTSLVLQMPPVDSAGCSTSMLAGLPSRSVSLHLNCVHLWLESLIWKKVLENILKAKAQTMHCRYVKLQHYVLPSSDSHSICGTVITPDHPEAFQLEIQDIKLPRWDQGSMFFDVVECHVVFPYGIGSFGTLRTVDWDISTWIQSCGLAGSCIWKLYEPLTSRMSIINCKWMFILLENNLTWWSWQQTETAWLILSVYGGIM